MPRENDAAVRDLGADMMAVLTRAAEAPRAPAIVALPPMNAHAAHAAQRLQSDDETIPAAPFVSRILRLAPIDFDAARILDF
jgi:hypothetical protein